MIFFRIFGTARDLRDAWAVVHGRPGRGVPADVMVGVYQSGLWLGFVKGEGPLGGALVEFVPNQPVAEIVQEFQRGGRGERTLWHIKVLSASVVERRYGVRSSDLYWIVEYVSFSHAVGDGWYLGESRDFRPH